MPRLARLDAPGILHHVMIRGIERRKVFLNDKDREDFIERLAKLLPETKTAGYAWVFIPNHAHFLFRTFLVPLARSLLCYWPVREAGMSLRELAGRLEMSGPGVGFAVERGEAIANENGYKLIE